MSKLRKFQPDETQAASSSSDEIRKLAELWGSGILTETEIQAKKAELLART